MGGFVLVAEIKNLNSLQLPENGLVTEMDPQGLII